MAITRNRLAKNIRFYKGTVQVGCVDGGDETITVDEIGTKCVASNGINTADPGDVTYDLNFKGISTSYTSPDAASNVEAEAFWDDAEAGTEITVIVGGANTGDKIKTYVGWVKSVKINHSIGANSTYDVAVRANSCTKGTRA
jgi:hypothetical protein